MKKSIVCIVTLVFAVHGFSQDAVAHKYSKEYYLQKSKNQRTTGWVLLGVGTTMAVLGAINFNSSWDKGSASETDTYGYIMLAGVACDLASIPFFISAGKNKRHAAEVAIGNQKMYLPQKNAVALRSVPALVLRLDF